MINDIHFQANCMTVIVGKAASKTGRVIVAHNEDDYIHAKVKHHFVPAADWAEGMKLPAEEGLTQIPQVRHTLAYSWVQITGPNGGMSASDCFLNEKGVCVVSDSSCGSREDFEDPKLCSDGIVYELRRAVAERAESAADALKIACELLDDYGYASPGRIYFFADRDEAYMLQIARGKMYVGCKIPDDAVMIMPNHYTIHSLNDLEKAVYPSNIIKRAIEKGWYAPQSEDYSDFDFARVYQNPNTYCHAENTLRQKYATQMALGREWSIQRDGLPPYVKAERPLGVEDLMEIMSTHYEGSDVDIRFGAGLSPHDTSVRRVCTATTVESIVYEFTDKADMTTAWTAFGRPCELAYIPLHPLYGELNGLEEKEEPYKAAQTHFLKKAYNTCHKEGYWQQMQDFQNLIEFKYVEKIGSVTQMKRRLFERFLKNEEELRKRGGDVNAADNETLKCAAEEIRRYMDKENIADAQIMEAVLSFREGISHASVQFELEGEPEEASVTFGPGRTETSKDYAKPIYGSLKRLYSNIWEIEFVFDKQPLKDDGQGTYEFILGGKTKDGRCFAAITEIENILAL